MYGLRESDIKEIQQYLAQYHEIESAVIFGSRALGHQKNGSDVDLAITGEEINFETILDISDTLNEDSDMPYRFDVLDYRTIQNQDLKDHIDRVGKILYQKNQTTVFPVSVP